MNLAWVFIVVSAALLLISVGAMFLERFILAQLALGICIFIEFLSLLLILTRELF